MYHYHWVHHFLGYRLIYILARHSTVVFTEMNGLMEHNVRGHTMYMTALCHMLTLIDDQIIQGKQGGRGQL